MKLLGFDKVLCVSPHPDDVEYSMLGTIMKHTDTMFYVLQLVQGGDFDETTGESRLDEVTDVWMCSEAKNIKIIFSPHKFVRDLREDGWINYIENVLEEHGKFDAIILPNETDSHFEHRFISGFGSALIRNNNISLIQYYTPSTQDEWTPNFYVEIENEYEKKIECLRLFTSQSHRYYFRDDVLRAFHSDFQCAKKGIHCIEKYKILNLYK